MQSAEMLLSGSHLQSSNQQLMDKERDVSNVMTTDFTTIGYDQRLGGGTTTSNILQDQNRMLSSARTLHENQSSFLQLLKSQGQIEGERCYGLLDISSAKRHDGALMGGVG